MAHSSDHMNIDRPKSNGTLYSTITDAHLYPSVFGPEAQEFEHNWLDPHLGGVNRSPQPQHNPQRSQVPSGQTPYNWNHANYYGASYQSNPAGFPSSSYAFPGHGSTFNSFSTTLDPSLVAPSTQHGGGFSTSAPFSAPFYSTATQFQGTIAPAALQHNGPRKTPTPLYSASGRPSQSSVGQAGSSASSMGQSVFSVVLPKGVANGRFHTIDGAELAKATQSTKLNNFVNLGIDPQEYSVQRITSIPAYAPRKSRNELKKLAANDPKIQSKLLKKQSKLTKTKAPKIPRPRLPFGRTDSKEVSTPSSIETTSSEEDSDYSSSDDQLEIVETPPYPEKRPQGALDAVKYDTVKAVWLPRRVHPSSDQIRSSMKNFWEVLSTLRDRHKSDRDALRAATEAKKQSELPMLRERVKSQRDMLETVLEAALQHGHPGILSQMGLNRPLIQMSRLFLADRIADNDVDSSLSKAILELLARCETITTELLEEFKVPKVLSQYSKRGNETFKKLVKQIEEKAAANSKDLASKPKQERTGEEKEKDGKVKAPYSKAPSSVPPRTSNSDSVVGVKRPPSSEPAATQPAKRLASTNGGAVKPSPTLQKRLPSAVSDKATPAAGAVSAKPKSQTAAKVPNMYAGLQSAAKKSSVANTAVAKKAAAAPSDKKSPAPAAPTAAKPASSFSFSDYMRDLNKPKEPEKPKKDPKEDRPPETEEQKAKRLRKESRRHLRVSFKEGSALADVRLFQHEADEDTGRDANMVRDAGDVGDEGRMFKQHKDQMLLDGDEDEEMTDADAENLLEFHLPTRVDFTRIPADERQRNYAPYGGGEQQPVSQEKAVQEKHESDTLMEVYMDKSDIPSSPREPSDPFTGETASAKDFGAPPKQVLDRTALFRHQQHATATTQAQATPDISALLSAISAQTQQANQPQQQPAQAAPSGYENLQNIFAQYSAPTPPAPPPQAAAPQTSTTSDLSAILASLQAHGTTPQPPQAQAPQASPPAQMMLFPNMFPGTGQMPDLNAMMAMFSQGGMPPPPPGMSGFAPPMQQQGSSGGHYEDPERKAMREGGNDGSSSYNQNSSKPKPSYQPPKFVVPCRYYQQGACKKGARCTFRHD